MILPFQLNFLCHVQRLHQRCYNKNQKILDGEIVPIRYDGVRKEVLNMSKEKVVLKQAKEVCELLGINNDRLKYFKKMGIFVSETKKAGYTANDIARLKQLVVLTKAGLTCDDIKNIDLGKVSFTEAIEQRRKIMEDKLQQIQGALSLSAELLDDGVQYDSMPSDYYLAEITRRESEGEEFMDFDDWQFELEMMEDIKCPNCGAEDTVDLEDYVYSESSDDRENGMGLDFIRYFDSEQSYECPDCGKVIRISGWKREYPIGAFDSENVDVSLMEEADE